MLRVGLTGNIASGKSLVAAQLTSLGAVMLDADQMGHALIGRNGSAVEEVLAAFGGGMKGPDGAIDRIRLGSVVFGDPGARSLLNSIVHPKLIAEIRGRLAALEELEGRQQGREGREEEQESRATADGVSFNPLIAVVDAALVFELGVADDFDRIVVITAPEAIREARLAGRGLSLEEARKRMASQWPEAEKVRRADHVIVNDGTAQELAARVSELWKELIRAAESTPRRKDRPK